MSRRGALAIGLVALTTSASCGYHLVGHAKAGEGVLPETIRVIAVLPFDNRTGRPEIEQRLTEEVALQLSRRGGYRVANDPSLADAVLEGAVTRYQTRAVAFNDEGRAIRIEAEVSVQASVREIATDQTLWSQSGLIFKEQFDVPPTGEFFDQESLALDGIARGAASVIVTSIVEGF